MEIYFRLRWIKSGATEPDKVYINSDRTDNVGIAIFKEDCQTAGGCKRSIYHTHVSACVRARACVLMIPWSVQVCVCA